MYYGLYIDVFFLVNFAMDYLLLQLVRKMLRCTTTHLKVFLGAVLGSVLTCIVVILPIPYLVLKLMVFHLLVNTCMIFVGLGVHTVREILKAIILLYISGFIMGGILESLNQYVKIGSFFLFFAILGYYVAYGIWSFLEGLFVFQGCHCQVEIVLGEHCYLIDGLLDTGNGLFEPNTKEPVSIVPREVADQIFAENQVDFFRWIPYQSIGKESGILKAFYADSMWIHGKKKHLVERPLIGVGEKGMKAFILHPDMVRGESKI